MYPPAYLNGTTPVIDRKVILQILNRKKTLGCPGGGKYRRVREMTRHLPHNFLRQNELFNWTECQVESIKD